ncbi:MAG: hypothetical protein MJ119_00170, partial [Lachnospiraceae bacterium]|nr:hypothetical protein [Lachnospiraceae bacterium]
KDERFKKMFSDKNFEIDFSGSTVISNGILIPLAVLKSSGITVKNVVFDNENTSIFRSFLGTSFRWLVLFGGTSRFTFFARHYSYTFLPLNDL